MKEETKQYAQQFIENRDKIKKIFSWDSGLIHLACASLYLSKNKVVNEKELQQCKTLMKEKVGIFNNFRGYVKTPVAGMLAMSSDAEEMLKKGLQVYELLKKEFFTSSYLPLASMVIVQLVEPFDYERIAKRSNTIYRRMKKEHPFLTSSEDSAFCVLMALSDKSDDILIRECEEGYALLKNNFFSKNAVQSLSHVLALCEGTAKEKCQRVMSLFDQLKESGHKYGTEYELPALEVLALSCENNQEIMEEIIEVDKWLANQKGFGFWSSVTKKQRLMYAGILVQKSYMQDKIIQQTAAITGTVSILIAQQVALCAAVAASAAATSANASS